MTKNAVDDFMNDDSDSSSDNESTTSGSKKNIRPMHNIGQACKFCKKRHIRCDGNFPCTQCVKRNLQCAFGTKTKRGPKPKTDLYEHCNKLMVDLEVQKQIAEYWREQFMTAMRKHGKDGNEFVEEHGLHPPNAVTDLERNGSSNGFVSPGGSAGGAGGASMDESVASSESSMVPYGRYTNSPSTLMMNVDSGGASMAAGSATNSSAVPYVPQITNRDPKPTLTIEQLNNMYVLFANQVQPLAPDYQVNFRAEVCLEVWNSTKAERDEMKEATALTEMFEHSVVAAHGFRLVAAPDVMHRFAKKAEDLLQLLFFQREAQCHPELAQRLVQVLIMLSFYYGGDDRDGSKQSVIMLAYQIISMHRTHIAPATMHRVYYTMMSLSENQADRVYWFNQASSLATQMKIKSLASVTAASMMFIFSSLHPKANFDQAPPSFTKPQLAAFLKKIDEARNYFMATNTTVDGLPLSPDAVSTFSVLMNGCRSELLFLLGEFQSAQTTAQWTIEVGAALERPVHISMFGIMCATEVALAMHMTPATQLALATFERHAPSLPIANRFRRRIMSQVDLNRANASSAAAAATGDSVASPDGIKMEHSPLLSVAPPSPLISASGISSPVPSSASNMSVSSQSSSSPGPRIMHGVSSPSPASGMRMQAPLHPSPHQHLQSPLSGPSSKAPANAGGALKGSPSSTQTTPTQNAQQMLTTSSEMMQSDYMHMNEELGYGLNPMGIHQLPTTDPHFGTQPSAMATPAQFRPVPLRMSGSMPNDDLNMYSDDYPAFN